MLYEIKFLYSLFVTLFIEIPIVIVFIKRIYKYSEIDISKIIFVGFIASVLTLPYLWFIFPLYISNGNLFIVIGELLVIVAESLIYNQLLGIKFSKSFLISLIANVASALIGVLL